jgi:hypothetical protein
MLIKHYYVAQNKRYDPNNLELKETVFQQSH